MKFIPENLLKDLQNISNIIENAGGECRLIGGCVRDCLVGKKPKDFDLASSLLPDKLYNLLVEQNYKVIPYALKYGTIIVVTREKIKIEITTLRKDVKCFGRQAEILFTTDWKLDAKRRDFTINALSMNMHGKIYDYFGGLDDLKLKIVRFIGDPIKRIEEDYLRILRYFRFLSYFGVVYIDEISWYSAKKKAKNLSKVSPQRIKNELSRLLIGDYNKSLLIKLNKNNLLHYFGFKDMIWSTDYLSKLLFHSNDWLVNLSIMVLANSNNKDFFFLKETLALTNKEVSILSVLIAFNKDDFFRADHNKYLYDYGKELYLKFLFVQKNFLYIEDHQRFLLEAKRYKKTKFPITGNDLKKIGYHDGKQIGCVLKKSKEYWHKNDNRLSKNELLKFAQNLKI